MEMLEVCLMGKIKWSRTKFHGKRTESVADEKLDAADRWLARNAGRKNDIKSGNSPNKEILRRTIYSEWKY